MDGIPLALELAAARLPSLGIKQLALALDDCFRVLTSGSRTALPRQRTLRGTLDWSYRLLTTDEARVFVRLAVFAGGWTLDAAEAICSDASASDDAPQLLSRLVDQSLVVAEDSSGATRYRFLEPVRQYAFELFDSSLDAETIRGRHAMYFMNLAEAAEPELLGPAQLRTLEQLEREHDNVRALLDWAERRNVDDDLALRTATAMVVLWHIRGYWREGRRRLQLALLQSNADDSNLRARALNASSWLAWDEGDYARASALSEEALSISRRLGDPWCIGWSSGRLSHVRWKQGRLDEAAALAHEAVNEFRALDAPWYVGWALHQLGRVAHSAGDDERAEASFEESLAFLHRAGDRGFATAFQFTNLGDVAAARGDVHRAVGLYEDALLHLRELDFKQGLVHTLHGLAGALRMLQEEQRAVETECEALRLCRDLGDLCGIAESLEGLAESARVLDRRIQLLAAAARLRQFTDCPSPPDGTLQAGDLARMRSATGRDAVERAWSSGAAMSLAEAVEFGLTWNLG